MDKPVVPTKRSIKDVGGIKSTPPRSSSRNGNKRLRRSPRLQRRQHDDKPVPMEIDPIEESVVVETSTPISTVTAAVSLANSNASLPKKLPIQWPSSMPSPGSTKELFQNLSKYVPKMPPTPQQVLEQLGRSAKKETSDKKKRKPSPKPTKAPPPSPFSPQRAATTAMETINRSLANSELPDRFFRNIASLQFKKTMVVPLVIILLVVPAVLVSLSLAIIPPSKQPNADVVLAFQEKFTENDARLPVYTRRQSLLRTILKESSLGLNRSFSPKWLRWLQNRGQAERMFEHIIPPKHVDASQPHSTYLADVTLREFLLHPNGIHLAMAPAFFGFYAYFGALAAWNEELTVLVEERMDDDKNNTTTTVEKLFLETRISSVAGGSAGAMAAVLIAAGICPKRAAEYVSTLTLSKFADPPGWGGLFKGDTVEELMRAFMLEEIGGDPLMEDATIPVAVTAFDLKSLQGKIVDKGCMARAARASATFPLLFQPVYWQEENETEQNNTDDATAAYLIDGGVTDGLGLLGLSVLLPEQADKRIVNVVVGGDFPGTGTKGPSDMPGGILASEVLSVSIRNTPLCGPWAMSNGRRAVEASRRAMKAALDIPLYKGKEPGHYELHIDASDFVP